MSEPTASFWDRRKAAVEAEAEDAAFAQRQEEAAAQEAALAEKSDDELLAELNLPDPDKLVSGDDVKAFMEKAVPERLRRRALRALWRTNPVLANLDSLVDYGEDYTDAALVIENMSTTYQVGKGMMAHIEKMAADAEAAELAEAEALQAEPGVPSEETPEIEETAPDEPADITPDLVAQAPASELDEDPDYMTPAPRRMTFNYKADSA
ncbi:MAG: DUF3306 domain-containing protein [Aliishimia sp.]